LRTDLQQKRKKSLQKAIASAKRILAVGHFERDGVTLFRLAAEKGLEGIVAKRADSPYRAGRSFDWIKIKTSAGRAIDEQRAKWNERPAIEGVLPPPVKGGRFDRRRDRR
jgi:ATP-dependent DNA ligase